MLVPPELQNYYTDDFNLNSKGQATRKLSEYGLICMDEFDKETTKKMPLLKNLMQMASLSFIKSYQKSFSKLPRIASFAGTSNRKDILTDPSVHIPADTRSAFPVISVQSPVSIQCCWQS